MDEGIVNYLKEGKDRGFSFDVLKKELIKGGFIAKDVDEAIASLDTTKKKPAIKAKIVKKVKKITKKAPVKDVKKPAVSKEVQEIKSVVKQSAVKEMKGKPLGAKAHGKLPILKPIENPTIPQANKKEKIIAKPLPKEEPVKKEEKKIKSSKTKLIVLISVLVVLFLAVAIYFVNRYFSF